MAGYTVRYDHKPVPATLKRMDTVLAAALVVNFRAEQANTKFRVVRPHKGFSSGETLPLHYHREIKEDLEKSCPLFDYGIADPGDADRLRFSCEDR